jgi:hypothetical protein
LKTKISRTIGYIAFGITAEGVRIEAGCRSGDLLATLGALMDAGAITVGYGSRIDIAEAGE